MEFFDVIFLGIFVILSPAFDRRFYDDKPPTKLVEEATFAIECFHSILHIFSERFFIVLEGEPIAHFYVFDRMLGEFAAAAVVFAKAYHEIQPEDYIDGNGEYGITYEMFRGHVEVILQASHPNILQYYSHCVDRVHKHFLWTGPKVDIFTRSKACDAIVLKPIGEHLDLPSHGIYASPQDPTPPTVIPHAGKRHDRDDGVGKQRKKRRM